jgi:hypothetical protein
MGKHFSLFCSAVNDEEKSLITLFAGGLQWQYEAQEGITTSTATATTSVNTPSR